MTMYPKIHNAYISPSPMFHEQNISIEANKPPKGQNKDEKRAEHNAVERARRECLNHKFRTLAKTLPNLQSFRRPSKGQIVEKALEWVNQALSREDQYQYRITQLENENKKLLLRLEEIEKNSAGQNRPVSFTSNGNSLLTTEHYVNWTQYPPSSSSPMLSGKDEDVSSSRSSSSIDDLQLLFQDNLTNNGALLFEINPIYPHLTLFSC